MVVMLQRGAARTTTSRHGRYLRKKHYSTTSHTKPTTRNGQWWAKKMVSCYGVLISPKHAKTLYLYRALVYGSCNGASHTTEGDEPSEDRRFYRLLCIDEPDVVLYGRVLWVGGVLAKENCLTPSRVDFISFLLRP